MNNILSKTFKNLYVYNNYSKNRILFYKLIA